MLSIIIPTLNEQDYLPFLLESLKKQNFKDYEIIVADAGSNDDTLKIAKSFGCRITNGGLPGKGRNEGVKVAKGEMFLFLDADNKLTSEHFLEKTVADFKKRKLASAAFLLLPEGNFIDKLFFAFYNLLTKITQGFLPHATNSILATREVHEKIKGFDEEVRLGEDQDYARRARKEGKFGFIDVEPIVTSARRFDREGRVTTYAKYVLAGVYMLLLGSIKSNIFNYKFDKTLKRKKN